MAEKLHSRELEGRIARIEELIHGIESIPDESVRSQAKELVQTLLELHGAGLERMLDMLFESVPSGAVMIDDLSRDNLVSNLLLLHGLHPLDLETRVRSAIESVKPRLGQHGGSVELIGVTPEGGIKLRLEGNCHGCPSSRITLKSSIEEAIYAAAPDVTSLEVEGAVDAFAHAPAGVEPKFTVCPSTNGQQPTTEG